MAKDSYTKPQNLEESSSFPGAVVAAWTGVTKGLAEIGANALPQLKSELKLPRCAHCGARNQQTAALTLQERLARYLITSSDLNDPQATIQTHINPGVSTADPSGYGSGTTAEDIAARHTTLGFHEGSHGSGFLTFFAQNPFPTFTGRVGMTERQFHAAERQSQAEPN